MSCVLTIDGWDPNPENRRQTTKWCFRIWIFWLLVGGIAAQAEHEVISPPLSGYLELGNIEGWNNRLFRVSVEEPGELWVEVHAVAGAGTVDLVDPVVLTSELKILVQRPNWLGLGVRKPQDVWIRVTPQDELEGLEGGVLHVLFRSQDETADYEDGGGEGNDGDEDRPPEIIVVLFNVPYGVPCRGLLKDDVSDSILCAETIAINNVTRGWLGGATLSDRDVYRFFLERTTRVEVGFTGSSKAEVRLWDALAQWSSTVPLEAGDSTRRLQRVLPSGWYLVTVSDLAATEVPYQLGLRGVSTE